MCVSAAGRTLARHGSRRRAPPSVTSTAVRRRRSRLVPLSCHAVRRAVPAALARRSSTPGTPSRRPPAPGRHRRRRSPAPCCVVSTCRWPPSSSERRRRASRSRRCASTSRAPSHRSDAPAPARPRDPPLQPWVDGRPGCHTAHYVPSSSSRRRRRRGITTRCWSCLPRRRRGRWWSAYAAGRSVRRRQAPVRVQAPSRPPVARPPPRRSALCRRSARSASRATATSWRARASHSATAATSVRSSVLPAAAARRQRLHAPLTPSRRRSSDSSHNISSTIGVDFSPQLGPIPASFPMQLTTASKSPTFPWFQIGGHPGLLSSSRSSFPMSAFSFPFPHIQLEEWERCNPPSRVRAGTPAGSTNIFLSIINRKLRLMTNEEIQRKHGKR